MNFLSNALFYDATISSYHKPRHPHTYILYLNLVSRPSHSIFLPRELSWTINFCSPARLRFLVRFSAIFRTVFADADPTLSNDSAKIRSGNGANPTPGHERALPTSLQDALSISVPQRRLTPFPARDGISLLNRIKTIRELPACRSCTARTSKRASDCSTLAISPLLLNDLTPLSLMR